jgi:hypothetical protein
MAVVVQRRPRSLPVRSVPWATGLIIADGDGRAEGCHVHRRERQRASISTLELLRQSTCSTRTPSATCVIESTRSLRERAAVAKSRTAPSEYGGDSEEDRHRRRTVVDPPCPQTVATCLRQGGPNSWVPERSDHHLPLPERFWTLRAMNALTRGRQHTQLETKVHAPSC